MLLTPQNTVVKGHDVEELQQLAEWTLENTLRHRIEYVPFYPTHQTCYLTKSF